MIKIGYIGFGRFAQLRHSILLKIPNLSFVGYFDANKGLSHQFNLDRFDSADHLLQSVDAVIISVPPVFAANFCKQALAKSVHVFCEKPPSIRLSDLDGLEQFSEDLVLGYGFNHRLHDSVMKIKDIIDSGKMGNILWMRGRYGKEVDADYKNNWRCDKGLNGGGILIDQGIHLLDIMDWLAGGFDVTQSILSDSYLNIKGVEDNAFLNLYCSRNEISASLHSTITQWRYLFSLEIFLEMGSLTLNGLRTGSGRYGEELLTIRPEGDGTHEGEPDDKEFNYLVNNSWEREMTGFVSSIQNCEPYPYSGLSDARNIMRLLENIYANAVWSHKNLL